ncbi:MAG: hypothetical protein LBR73_02945 [Oscillospiraceae bacterium]|jgi:hypothetical protein|nr:hypothetical protein [Oscillospiraceae bacterium]
MPDVNTPAAATEAAAEQTKAAPAVLTPESSLTLTLHRGLVQPKPDFSDDPVRGEKLFKTAVTLRTLGDFDYITLSLAEVPRHFLDTSGAFSKAAFESSSDSAHSLLLVPIAKENLSDAEDMACYTKFCLPENDTDESYPNGDFCLPENDTYKSYSDWPFLFVSLVHLDVHTTAERHGYAQRMFKQMNELVENKQTPTGKPEMVLHAYDTVDTSDLAFIYRSRYYQAGFEFASAFFKQQHGKYSYSVCGIHPKALKSPRSVIPKIALCAVKKDGRSVTDWYASLEEEVNHLKALYDAHKGLRHYCLHCAESTGSCPDCDAFAAESPKLEEYFALRPISVEDATPEKMKSWAADFPEGHSPPRLRWYRRLGSEDVIVNIDYAEGSWFFRHLLGTGFPPGQEPLFSPSKDGGGNLFSKAFMRPRLHLDIGPRPVDGEQEALQETDHDAVSFDKQNFFTRYREACQTTLRVDKEKEAQLHSEIHKHIHDRLDKALCEVLKSIDHLDEDNFVPDVVDCIRYAFPLFLYKLQKYLSTANAAVQKNGLLPKEEYQAFNRDLEKYIQSLVSFLNGSLQADRIFFQVPGFNAVLYDAPAKLMHFYTAYLHRCAEVLAPSALKANDHNYDSTAFAYRFLLVPDINEYMEITEFFHTPDKRDTEILAVYMPVDMLFKPERILFELAHECAHHVGDDFRNRKKRYRYLKEAMLADFETWLLTGLETLAPKESTCRKQVIEAMKKLWDEVVQTVEGNAGRLEYHKNKIESYLRDIHSTFCDNAYELMDKVYPLLLRQVTDEAQYKKLSNWITAFNENIKAMLLQRDKYIRNLLEVTSESFADTIAMTLFGWDKDTGDNRKKHLREYIYKLYNYRNTFQLAPHGARLAVTILGFWGEGVLKWDDLKLTESDTVKDGIAKTFENIKKLVQAQDTLIKVNVTDAEERQREHFTIPTPAALYALAEYTGACKEDLAIELPKRDAGLEGGLRTIAEVYAELEDKPNQNLRTFLNSIAAFQAHFHEALGASRSAK